MQVNIELSETDKVVLQLALQTLYRGYEVLSDMGYYIDQWGAPTIDRNTIYCTAEKLGIDLK